MNPHQICLGIDFQSGAERLFPFIGARFNRWMVKTGSGSNVFWSAALELCVLFVCAFCVSVCTRESARWLAHLALVCSERFEAEMEGLLCEM